IINRWRLLPRGYLPKPWLCVRRLWVAHDAADYWSVRVTESHIIVGVVCTTAFACRYKNKVGVFDLGMHHRNARHDQLCAACVSRCAPKVELNFAQEVVWCCWG